jgi:hypothetical protein
MNSQADAGEVLAGLVERVTYNNSENGFQSGISLHKAQIRRQRFDLIGR